jgi:predicted component of type VI protein secretion system
MFKSDGARREFPVARSKFVVGRKNNCDLRIPLSSVSRQHCEIRLDGDAVKLRDLGSSNGTYHNAIRVQEAVLSPGDEIVIGPVVFTVVIDGKPTEIKPIRTLLGNGHADSSRAGTIASAEAHSHQSSHGSAMINAGSQAPTVDLEDPLAALERLAEAEQTQQPIDLSDMELLADDDDDK